jgi:hypothetical protein
VYKNTLRVLLPHQFSPKKRALKKGQHIDNREKVLKVAENGSKMPI